MTKEQAIDVIKSYLESKPFSWEAIYHVDDNPEERSNYWLFKSLWEPRESLRGDNILVDTFHPYLVLNKDNKGISEIHRNELSKLEKIQ